MVCLVTNVLVTVVGLKLLSTPLAVCVLVMILEAVGSMVRPEGPAEVVGVLFDADVAVAAIAVVVASREEIIEEPVCLRPCRPW